MATRELENTKEGLRDEPWTEAELDALLERAAAVLGMTSEEAADAYRNGSLPDVPASFDVGTALYLLERVRS